MRVVIYQAPHTVEEGIGMGHAPLDIPQVLPHGGFREGQGILDGVGSGPDQQAAAAFHFILHHLAQLLVLDDGNHLHQNGGDDYNSHAGHPILTSGIHTETVTTRKVMICF